MFSPKQQDKLKNLHVDPPGTSKSMKMDQFMKGHFETKNPGDMFLSPKKIPAGGHLATKGL